MNVFWRLEKKRWRSFSIEPVPIGTAGNPAAKKGRGTLRPHACLKYQGLMASAVTAAIPTVAFATEAAAATRLFGASFVDGEVAAIEGRSVHGIDGFLCLFGRTHRDENKAARATGGSVHQEVSL